MLWDSRRLFLIMEYLDYDLHEHMACNNFLLSLEAVKVSGAGREGCLSLSSAVIRLVADVEKHKALAMHIKRLPAVLSLLL